MKNSPVVSTVLLAVAIFAAISSVESTWILNRRCNGTTVEGWGSYLIGDCSSSWGLSSYSTCSGSEYTSYMCMNTTCQNCKPYSVQAMNECSNQDFYYTCASGDPDYSVFGSSYATAQIYSRHDKNCAGNPITIYAAPINKCLNSVFWGSVYIACSKDGTATRTTYTAFDCQGNGQITTVNTNTCIANTTLGIHFIATCTGF